MKYSKLYYVNATCNNIDFNLNVCNGCSSTPREGAPVVDARCADDADDNIRVSTRSGCALC